MFHTCFVFYGPIFLSFYYYYDDTIQGFYSSLPVPHFILVDGPDTCKCTYIPLDCIPNKICAYEGAHTRICQGIRVCQCCDWSWITRFLVGC